MAYFGLLLLWFTSEILVFTLLCYFRNYILGIYFTLIYFGNYMHREVFTLGYFIRCLQP